MIMKLERTISRDEALVRLNCNHQTCVNWLASGELTACTASGEPMRFPQDFDRMEPRQQYLNQRIADYYGKNLYEEVKVFAVFFFKESELERFKTMHPELFKTDRQAAPSGSEAPLQSPLDAIPVQKEPGAGQPEKPHQTATEPERPRPHTLKRSERLVVLDEFEKRCRELAKTKWAVQQDMIIPKMVDYLLRRYPEGYRGQTVTPGTVRNWIKDLCPNRKPGRRVRK